MSDQDDFVSRLARGLWLHKTPLEDLPKWKWEDLPRSEQMYWTLLALAAMRTIREPTTAMCAATGISDAAVIWRTMVDAADQIGDFDPASTDPTTPLPPEQVEEAYRRGFQQGCSYMLGATERYVEDRHRKRLTDWVNKTLFKWRYGFKGRGIRAPAPFPPHNADL